MTMNIFAPKTRFGAVCCALSLLVSSITACGPKEEPITPSTPGGDTTVPVAKVSPDNATNKTVTWSSSKSSVATVSNGTVKAVAEGTATIMAKAGGKSATCLVTVTSKEVAVTGITLSPTTLNLNFGETATLTATITPSNATATVTWSTSNIMIASVDNGKVTAEDLGEATITASAGGKSATCLVTVKADGESAVKAALMKIYNAMDGVHWTLGNKWDVSKPLNDWECVEWDSSKKELKLTFGGVGLKGEFPDCFDELTSLTWLLIQNEPGVTGTLPASFGKLKNLKWMILNTTSMTSLPDFFKDIPFTFVSLNGNEKMAGPLPASLPGSNPTSVEVQLWGNAFTGTVPDSWASLGTRLKIENETHLDERVPDSFLTAADASYLINMYLELSSWRETPIVVGDYDIPAFWPKRGLKDIVTGKSIPYKEICAKNKVTILLNWGTWCPFSKEIMPILKQMYEKYHKDGLEIIAAFNASSDTSDEGRPLKDVLLERGYDQWYNFNIWDLSTTEWSIWCAGTPSATLVDKDGNTIASGKTNVSDPLRNRFGYTASTTLIPTLESIFGPVEGDDGYESTDYSQDGQVVTIQTAATGKGINLVFMGDAYTDKDIASGLYMEMMREAANQFFSIEPYKTFKNRFNVYAVKVVSKNGKTGAGYTTALGTQFVNGSAATGNEDKIYNYALKVPGISDKKNLTIGVLVNTIYHGGIASMSESLQSGIGYYASNGGRDGRIQQEVQGLWLVCQCRLHQRYEEDQVGRLPLRLPL